MKGASRSVRIRSWVFVKANSPDEFSAFIRAEISKWAKVVEQSGAKAD